MKSSAVTLVLAALVGSSSAKKYFNRQIYKDKTGVLGPRAHHIYESPDEEVEQEVIKTERHGPGLKGHAHGRRTEGEIPLPPSFDEEEEFHPGDDEDDGMDPETLFYEARDLDFMKKGIDPEHFEWVNPDEIAPGATTCGFLKPDLGSLTLGGLPSDITYPVIRVYVCMRFADTQPASKGNLFVHCGGPSSLSDCVMLLGDPYVVGSQVLNDYNILAIDQVSKRKRCMPSKRTRMILIYLILLLSYS